MGIFIYFLMQISCTTVLAGCQICPQKGRLFQAGQNASRRETQSFVIRHQLDINTAVLLHYFSLHCWIKILYTSMNLGPCSHIPMNNMKNVDACLSTSTWERTTRLLLDVFVRKTFMIPNQIPLQLLPMGISLPRPLHEKEVVPS